MIRLVAGASLHGSIVALDDLPRLRDGAVVESSLSLQGVEVVRASRLDERNRLGASAAVDLVLSSSTSFVRLASSIECGDKRVAQLDRESAKLATPPLPRLLLS